jgi:prepilin-type N-terminal cleavage/methylation domain-containing protein
MLFMNSLKEMFIRKIQDAMPDSTCCAMKKCRNNSGFSLVEMMVVMVIIAILAIGVVFMFADPTAKVKAAAFELRGDLNLARAEAVKRNANIMVQFVDSAKEPVSYKEPPPCSKKSVADFDTCFSGGSRHGYVICFDEDGDNDCSDEAADATELEEKVIKAVVFSNDVHFYKVGATLPTSPYGPAPGATPDNEPLISDDGITFGGGRDYIYMNSNGTSSDTGAVIVYLPEDGNPASQVVRGKPYAVVIDSESTGRVRLERWRPEKNEWARK